MGSREPNPERCRIFRNKRLEHRTGRSGVRDWPCLGLTLPHVPAFRGPPGKRGQARPGVAGPLGVARAVVSGVPVPRQQWFEEWVQPPPEQIDYVLYEPPIPATLRPWGWRPDPFVVHLPSPAPPLPVRICGVLTGLGPVGDWGCVRSCRWGGIHQRSGSDEAEPPSESGSGRGTGGSCFPGTAPTAQSGANRAGLPSAPDPTPSKGESLGANSAGTPAPPLGLSLPAGISVPRNRRRAVWRGTCWAVHGH